jgi:hypothetical protein
LTGADRLPILASANRERLGMTDARLKIADASHARRGA